MLFYFVLKYIAIIRNIIIGKIMAGLKNKIIFSLLFMTALSSVAGERYRFQTELYPKKTETPDEPKENGEEWRNFFLAANVTFKDRIKFSSSVTARGIDTPQKWNQGGVSWYITMYNIGLLDSEIPKGTFGLNSIGFLGLSGNKLTNVDFLAGISESTQSLELERNGLVNLKGLSNLKVQKDYFKLQKNSFTSLNGLQNLTQIRSLHIYDNPQLTDISAISNLASYGTVYMDDPSQYKSKPKIGSVFCNSIRDKKIRARVTVSKGTTTTNGPELTVNQVCSQ